MKRFLWLMPAVLILLSGAAARAQETPGWEAGGGYSYLKANLKGPSFHLNGGTGSITQNLNDWFGGRIEASFFQGTVSGTTVSAQTYTYGPVFSYRHFDRITPFVHAQFGAIHGSLGYLGISTSAFKFAMTAGGGVDLKVKRNVAIRLQGDYLMTHFLALRQDNVQGSVGLVFYLGTK
jgi:opacity protein-like surface antigen